LRWTVEGIGALLVIQFTTKVVVPDPEL
jgi:hypothetical protein